MRVCCILVAAVLSIPLALSFARTPPAPLPALRPGTRVVLDAHNCYPYFEWWTDRIDRALSAGTPLAIEQDLLWTKNTKTGEAKSVVSHGAPATGEEPSLRDYNAHHGYASERALSCSSDTCTDRRIRGAKKSFLRSGCRGRAAASFRGRPNERCGPLCAAAGACSEGGGQLPPVVEQQLARRGTGRPAPCWRVGF